MLRQGLVDVEVVEHVWIRTSDGTRLSARVWIPTGAAERPVPAVVDCLPYRHSDGTTASDARLYGALAEHGYACARVDIRGSGNSDGILADEYLAQEQEDAVEVIAWVAAQPWCDGAVGYMGVSWGGFGALQVAARNPPALRAVISVCASDDRYADDVHYTGGCVQSVDMLPWASYMLVHNALPPDPEIVGESWRDMWLERAQQTPPFIDAWLSRQRRDQYWQQGSVDDATTIRTPVYAMGGWSDGYSDAVMRLVERLPGPRKGLIGPWSHGYPDQARPGPNIDFVGECVRWWDHWLLGVDNGIMDEPVLRAWMQDSVIPTTSPKTRPGRWVAEGVWPPNELRSRTWYLSADGLTEQPGAEGILTHVDGGTVGRDAGPWCPSSAPGDWPGDQRGDDGRSLTFTSAPLADRLEILGAPVVEVELGVDQPRALLTVRLCDVAPDGPSLLVSRAVLNLTHRSGHELAEDMMPNEAEQVRVQLKTTGHAFPAGHRIRISLSTTYWPWAWPSPAPVALAVTCGGASRLTLPVRPTSVDEGDLTDFAPPTPRPAPDATTLRPGRVSRKWNLDVATGEWQLATVRDSGRRRLRANRMEVDFSEAVHHTMTDGRPLTAEVRCDNHAERARGDWRVRIESSSRMTSTQDEFLVNCQLDGYEGDHRVFTRSWSLSFPRDGV